MMIKRRSKHSTNNTNENTMHKYNSVSIRMPILFVTSCMVIVLIFVGMLYYKFQTRMFSQYLYIAKGATQLMALELDGDKVDEYLEQNFESEEYDQILDQFYNIRDCYPDIYYMYVYRLDHDGGTVIFDLNSVDGTEDAGLPGEHYEFGEEFMKHIDALCAGEDIPGLIGDTEDGYMFTYCRAIYDSNGVLQCHACVDFSMEELHRQDLYFIYSILAVTGIGALLIMLFGIFRIRKEITDPLNQISQATDRFSYMTEEDHANNIRIMKELDIHTHNEIERVYHEFISVMEQSQTLMINLSQAKTDIKVKDEQIGQISQEAYLDSLTGVGSKAAYDQYVSELNERIAMGFGEFAIVMVDMNDLKRINDEHGHKAGDSYIKGCCHLICETFKHSPVFRIGGDEFVVILTGQEYNERTDHVELLRSAYRSAFENESAEPWERYSAAVGIAEHASDDNSYELVFKRADAAMYEEKKKYKKMYGSYR